MCFVSVDSKLAFAQSTEGRPTIISKQGSQNNPAILLQSPERASQIDQILKTWVEECLDSNNTLRPETIRKRMGVALRSGNFGEQPPRQLSLIQISGIKDRWKKVNSFASSVYLTKISMLLL